MRTPLPTLSGVEHRFLELPGLRMRVAEAGAGEPVLLLHGFTQHWWAWREVIPGLSERYRVICPDLRGSGWTQAPPSGYAREQLMADVLALLDRLDVDRVRLIGHDWGGLLGFLLCMERPERVQRFLSLATPPPFLKLQPAALRGLPRLWFQAVIAMPGLGERLLAADDQRLARHLLDAFRHDPSAWSAGDVELFVAQYREPAYAHAGSLLYRNFILAELGQMARGRFRHARLTTPTRILVGDRDPVLRPQYLRGLDANSPILEVREVRDASHYIADEQPDAVVAHAVDCFAQQ